MKTRTHPDGAETVSEADIRRVAEIPRSASNFDSSISLTVADLIKQLQVHPPNAVVLVVDSEYGASAIDTVKLVPAQTEPPDRHPAYVEVKLL